MIQFYFLSILLNALAGYTLITERDETNAGIEKFVSFSIDNEMVRLVLGIATMATGVLKILSRIQGDIPVIGDLLPALVGLVAGFILVFDYYRAKSTMDMDKADKIGTLLNNRKWIGYIALGTAVLHFLFPTVLFL